MDTIIDYAGTYTFKDSFRVFPVLLSGEEKARARLRNIPGKLSEYQSEWNDPSVFNNNNKLKNY